MSLSPIQRELVESLLGVKPRRKGLHIATSDEKQDKKIGSALDDYERREGKVLEAVKSLESVPATGQIVVDLEQRVSLIRRSVMTSGRDVAPQVIEKAYDDLETIKKEAEAAAKLANANKDFYASLANADRDLQSLENHEHHGFITNQTGVVETTLQQARDAAKIGDFSTANARLGTATDASRDAKQVVDQYGRDLTAFNIKAEDAANTLAGLDAHPKKAAAATELGNGDGKVATARTEAKAGRFPEAGQLLLEAKQAHADAKKKADDAFILDIDAAEQDLTTVRDNDDPSVVKAMAHTVGEINTILQTARSQVAADIAEADKSLKTAQQRITAAKGIRDQVVIDLKKVRDAAAAADNKLNALNAHPQKLHVKTEIDAATAKLVEVRTEITEGRVDTALLFQEEVDRNCTTGKDCADKYAAFLVVYADAMRICNGSKKVYDNWPNRDTAIVNLNAAKNKASVDRKYAEATVDANNAMTPVKSQKDFFKNDRISAYDPLINDLTSKVAGLVPAKQTKKPGTDASALDNTDPDPVSIIQGNMQKIADLKALIQSTAEAGKFEECTEHRKNLTGMITATKKIVDRRGKYNTQRELTLTAIQGLGTYKSLLGHMMSLNNLVVRADKLATSKDMRFEDACKELADIQETCKLLVEVGKQADLYLQERAEADTAMEELKKLKAA